MPVYHNHGNILWMLGPSQHVWDHHMCCQSWIGWMIDHNHGNILWMYEPSQHYRDHHIFWQLLVG